MREGQDFTLHAVTPAGWKELSEKAHLIAFKEKRPAKQNTYDFALVAASPTEIFGYATVIEMDNETAYMQHGGAMPNIKGTIGTKRVYGAMIGWLKSRYKRVSTRIQNKNSAMLKLAMSEGFLIHGCDCYPDGVYLHLGLGFE